jgi:hypothetical protein
MPTEQTTKKSQIGRLALRVEGLNWNAYYALPDTMEGAIPLGSIRFGAVCNNLKRKQAFMDLMQGIVAEILKKRFGVGAAWTYEIAPEHERQTSIKES